MQRVMVLLLVVGLWSCLGACATPPLQSTNTAPLSSTDVREGTRYALPLRLLQIQIWEGTVDGAKTHYAVLAGSNDVPDPRFQYLLSYRGSALSSDDLSWEVKNGFLHSVKAKTKDESLTSLNSAVELFIEVAKAAASLSGAPTPGAAVTKKALRAQYVIDPLSPRGRQQLDAIRTRFGVTISIQVRGVNQCDVNPELPGCGQGAPACVSGIAYRAEYPYVLTMAPMALLKGSGASQSHEHLVHGEQVVMLPNRSPVTVMHLTRAAFIEQDMQLSFTNGVLTKVSVDKPSQLKSFFDSLLDPVRAVASIPGELFKVRIEKNTNAVNFMKSEAEVLEQMRAFLDAQDQHRAAMGERNAVNGGGGNAPALGN